MHRAMEDSVRMNIVTIVHIGSSAYGAINSNSNADTIAHSTYAGGI